MNWQHRVSTVGLSLVLALLSSGCCRVIPEQQPVRPNASSHWGERTVSGVTTVGYFVMNKGESIDNGELGVKVLDLIPSKCKCATCIPSNPTAQIGFYRPPDNTIVCRGEFQGSESLKDFANCDASLGVTDIYIYAINTKEQWVVFDLRKPGH